MKKIVYLNAEDSAKLEFSSKKKRDEKVLEHENHEVYSLEDFADAFNEEVISDLGIIVILKTQE